MRLALFWGEDGERVKGWGFDTTKLQVAGQVEFAKRCDAAWTKLYIRLPAGQRIASVNAECGATLLPSGSGLVAIAARGKPLPGIGPIAVVESTLSSPRNSILTNHDSPIRSQQLPFLSPPIPGMCRRDDERIGIPGAAQQLRDRQRGCQALREEWTECRQSLLH